ncbi:hypothetical protein IX39_05200 [Chryseobacterium formosense]|uniref:Addiction module component n=1 Tax=Chryseobacterium formosense TaxID=236814 RepID=A0A085Z6K2_9FLAO|nr:lysine N(6)-hydroxylase/L-ornithine N(5)-oxygenase family protein [Chryseobacterium formosense]KFF00066.1 hypothetical protein IX39_05200 [Chryseobacterium formosense]SFT61529.1 hypothetical protein SAMN05421857_2126 [Chryseobacterium formosense]
MNAAEIKLDLINRIANLKDSKLIEEIKNLLDFEQDNTVFQLNEEQKSRLLDAQKDEILDEDEANNEIEKWLQEK